MHLNILLKDIFPVPADVDVDIERLVLDSRLIQPNDLFLAVNGSHFDGRQYISQALARGAQAVLVDVDEARSAITWQQQKPLIPITHLQSKLGMLAARFYQEPAKHLAVMGVTGTNGKTSCTHFLAQMLQALHTPCGIIGTLGSGFYGALGSAGLTTPDAVTLQATLRQLVDQGARAIAMEVSSHSIDQGRVNGIEFTLGIFTNLTQDHLDYHGDMATYAAVKRRFFAELPTQHLIINADDAYGRQWIDELALLKPIHAYSTKMPVQTSVPCIYTQDVQINLAGISATVITPWGEGELALPLIGQFNLSNALAVLTALCVHGVPLAVALQQLAFLQPVLGRMQTLGGQDKPLVVVDFAHTPDALEKVLQALRSHVTGKLVCVFGCGGERDPGKRPIMAAIAEQWADVIIVTNDNPRHEDPQVIAEQILRGFKHPESISVELDRAKAIEKALQSSTVNDCVLIAGKGAEHYQQIGDVKIPFDDAEQVKNYLQAIEPR